MPVYRDRPAIAVTLTPEAIGALDELAAQRGVTRSTMVELMVRDESLRSRLDLKQLGTRERKKRGMTKAPR
jgi:hypothetical protein